jgi:hypothetical protein
MKAYGGSGGIGPPFFTSALYGGEWSASCPCSSTSWGNSPRYPLDRRLGETLSPSESESYITTDGQLASLSWNKSPIWGLRPDFYYCQTVARLLICGALSDVRTGLSFTIAAGPRQRSHSRSGSHGTRGHILLSQI